MRISTKIKLFSAFLGMAALLGSCEDSKSYSELLTDEEHAVNWYLAQNTVALDIPADGKFITGKDAPFYKMDEDGYVYMRVIEKGSDTDKPVIGDRVYFRFMRMDLKTYQASGVESWDGNAIDFDQSNSTSLIYGNTVLTSTTQYGEGIQVPLKYLGYNSEVCLIVKSPQGFTTDASQCIPYIYKMRYFKAEY